MNEKVDFNWKKLLQKKVGQFSSCFRLAISYVLGEISSSINLQGFYIHYSILVSLFKLQTDEIVRLNGIYKRLLANAGVKLFEGEGKVVGPNEVEVTQLDGTKLSYSAKHILISTGSRAHRPRIPGEVDLHHAVKGYIQLLTYVSCLVNDLICIV